MIVVVDTNILLSACISPNNKINEILLSPLPNLERVSCYYAFAELFRHQAKIVKLAKQPVDDVTIVLHTILKKIEFLNENIIEKGNWIEADRLTSGVDANDINFVALALQIEGWLWTGDKKLANHLKSMGFNKVLNTGEIYEMIF